MVDEIVNAKYKVGAFSMNSFMDIALFECL